MKGDSYNTPHPIKPKDGAEIRIGELVEIIAQADRAHTDNQKDMMVSLLERAEGGTDPIDVEFVTDEAASQKYIVVPEKDTVAIGRKLIAELASDRYPVPPFYNDFCAPDVLDTVLGLVKELRTAEGGLLVDVELEDGSTVGEWVDMQLEKATADRPSKSDMFLFRLGEYVCRQCY
jgi:hypothetical protein